MKIVDRTKHLFDCLGCILLCEFALLADTIKQLASRRQFRDNVVFVLLECKQVVVQPTSMGPGGVLTLDSNQSTNLTIWGCFKRWSMSSSS